MLCSDVHGGLGSITVTQQYQGMLTFLYDYLDKKKTLLIFQMEDQGSLQLVTQLIHILCYNSYR